MPFFLFFFNDTATTEIYTLSLHDALPISTVSPARGCRPGWNWTVLPLTANTGAPSGAMCARVRRQWQHRSEEHTSELQSRPHLVCRLLLEKKKNKTHKA